MADGKFFTDDTKDLIVDVLDGLTKLGILEALERPAYRIVLNQVDKYADKAIPDIYDAQINEVVILALNKEFEKAAEKAGRIIDDLVDFEKINDDIEKLVFVDGLKFIVRQIQLYIEKEK
jgi:hypothetical protein